MSSWRTAPTDYGCCYRCKRYLPPEKLEANACIDRESCRKASVTGNRAKRRSAKAAMCEVKPRRKRAA